MSRSLFRHARARFIVYGMAAVCVLVIALDAREGWQRGQVDWLSLVPWFAMLGFWVTLRTWLVPRNEARAQQKFHSGSRWLTLDDEGVRSGCDTCSLLINWANVRKANETREFVFVFVSANAAAWLPKRVLSDAELGRVRTMIREKLGKRAKLHAA